VGYTLSWTRRYFDNLNGGDPFPARYDRRHDLSVVAIYEPESRWQLSAVFVFGSGQTTTLPIGTYFIEGALINEYGPRNGYRMVPYHRLDFSATLLPKETAKFQSSWTFAIYNVYSRKNPYFIYYDVEGNVANGDLSVLAKQVSLFPIIPTITWNFKF
jgi:hypothetical protein